MGWKYDYDGDVIMDIGHETEEGEDEE